jgi:hypothetical protein
VHHYKFVSAPPTAKKRLFRRWTSRVEPVTHPSTEQVSHASPPETPPSLSSPTLIQRLRLRLTHMSWLLNGIEKESDAGFLKRLIHILNKCRSEKDWLTFFKGVNAMHLDPFSKKLATALHNTQENGVAHHFLLEVSHFFVDPFAEGLLSTLCLQLSQLSEANFTKVSGYLEVGTPPRNLAHFQNAWIRNPKISPSPDLFSSLTPQQQESTLDTRDSAYLLALVDCYTHLLPEICKDRLLKVAYAYYEDEKFHSMNLNVQLHYLRYTRYPSLYFDKCNDLRQQEIICDLLKPNTLHYDPKLALEMFTASRLTSFPELLDSDVTPASGESLAPIRQDVMDQVLKLNHKTLHSFFERLDPKNTQRVLLKLLLLTL